MINNSSSIRVASALNNEVSDILLRDWEIKVVGENLLDISGVDLLLVSLVKQSEALTGLLSVSMLLDESVTDAVLKEVIFETVSLQEVWVMLSNFIINFLR